MSLEEPSDPISRLISGIEALQHCTLRAADGTSFGCDRCPFKGPAATDMVGCDLRDCSTCQHLHQHIRSLPWNLQASDQPGVHQHG